MSVVAQNLLVRAQPCPLCMDQQHTFREEFGSSSKDRSSSCPVKSLEGEAVLWYFPWNPVKAVLPFVFQRERLLLNGWENARAIDMMKVYSFLPQADVKRYHFWTQKSSSDALSKVLPKILPKIPV